MEGTTRGKQLLVMTVDIGDGRQDFIAIYEHDDPAWLAQEFASKYNLDPMLQRNLAIMIKENTNEVLRSDLHRPDDSASECSSDSPYLSPIKTENMTSKSRTVKSRTVKSTKGSTKVSPSKPAQSRGSVYGAIYKSLQKAANSKSVSSGISQEKSKKSMGFNYGDYLYAKGLKSKEQNQKFQEMKKQEKFEKEIHNFTFSPLINTNSSMISPRVYDKPENILMKKKEEKLEKLKKMREEQEAIDNKECIFTPKINENSKSRDCGGKIHEFLYLQAEQLKERKEERAKQELKQIPFKPDVKNARKKNVFETKEQLFDRLEASKKVSEEEISKLRSAKSKIEMDEVGQRFSGENNLMRHNSEPIWEYLYSQKDSKKNNFLLSQQDSIKQLERASISKKTTENSDKIYNDFRTKQYEKLFKLMDSDADGLIAATAININNVNVNILKVLTPFFEDLERTRVNLSLNDFCGKMEELYRSLNVEKRAILIKRADKKEEEEPERKPYISMHSMNLAEKKKSSLPTDFLERQSTVTKMTELRMQKIRDEKEEAALKECTFKPLVKSN